MPFSSSLYCFRKPNTQWFYWQILVHFRLLSLRGDSKIDSDKHYQFKLAKRFYKTSQTKRLSKEQRSPCRKSETILQYQNYALDSSRIEPNQMHGNLSPASQLSVHETHHIRSNNCNNLRIEKHNFPNFQSIRWSRESDSKTKRFFLFIEYWSLRI